jgi:hypothetical protein
MISLNHGKIANYKGMGDVNASHGSHSDLPARASSNLRDITIVKATKKFHSF